jgi:predicted O-methyltransferase YrrM
MDRPKKDGIPEPSTCVVLVPVRHAIDPACEAGLRELESRGYLVRRTHCQDSVDQTFSQLATSALRDGFKDTIWIHPSICFNPDDVDRLRRHSAPAVFGLYPRESHRELSAKLPENCDVLELGTGGGLVEIDFSLLGFALVRADVFHRIQRDLNLPLCDSHTSQPLIPFFTPMWTTSGESATYLQQEFAFCERARSVGWKLYADTTIRLWRAGNYHYGWEDLCSPVTRKASVSLRFGNPRPATDDRSKAKSDLAIARFRESYPWPNEQPNVPARTNDGWLQESTRQVLERILSNRTKVVVEIGSWLGLSTRFIASKAPNATVLAVDHWRGSDEHQQEKFQDILPILFETFLVNCWYLRERLIPIRQTSVRGMQEIATYGIHPDVVYIDADHSHDAVVKDLEAAIDLFPEATIVGDDFNWPGVESAVRYVTGKRNRRYHVTGVAWELMSQ